jgi:hypothetical protein
MGSADDVLQLLAMYRRIPQEIPKATGFLFTAKFNAKELQQTLLAPNK